MCICNTDSGLFPLPPQLAEMVWQVVFSLRRKEVTSPSYIDRPAKSYHLNYR
jgi:hypothetical protein